jgi:anti-sigma B factor antagonist
MPEKHGGHWLEREDLGDVTVVRVKARALQDDDTTAEMFRQVFSLVNAVGRHNLVLNLGAVEYVASLALGKLVLLNRKAEAAQGRLALCHLTRAVADALEVTHLADVLTVYPDEQEAVRSFA